MRFDVVIIGGGLAGTVAGVELLKNGKSCAIVSEGLSLHRTQKAEFIRLGGVFIPGDSVIGGEWEGDVLLRVKTRNLEGTFLEADAFILTTGKFFSRGIISDMDRVFEPVFGAEVEYDPDPAKWCLPDFSAPQPFEEFGLRTDEGRVIINGRTANNLYAAGEILSGRRDIEQSALEVCRRII